LARNTYFEIYKINGISTCFFAYPPLSIENLIRVLEIMLILEKYVYIMCYYHRWKCSISIANLWLNCNVREVDACRRSGGRDPTFPVNM